MITKRIRQYHPRWLVPNLMSAVLLLGCDGNEKTNTDDAIGNSVINSNLPDEPNIPRQVSNKDNENRERKQKIDSLLLVSCDDALQYIQELMESNLIDADEYDDLLLFLLEMHITISRVPGGDPELVATAAEKAINMYFLISDEGKIKVFTQGLTNLILNGLGTEKAIEFYESHHPGQSRVRIAQQIARFMRDEEQAPRLVAFIDGLEYAEERNATLSYIDESHVFHELGGDLASLGANIHGIQCENLKARIFSLYFSKAETTDSGMDLAAFLTENEGGMPQRIRDAGWRSLAHRPDLSIDETMDILDIFPDSDGLRDSVIRRIAHTEITLREPDDFLNFIDRLGRDEQIMAIRELPRPQSSQYTYDLISLIADDELRDIYLGYCARSHAIITRNAEDNPYLDQMSSREARENVHKQIEYLLKGMEEDGV